MQTSNGGLMKAACFLRAVMLCFLNTTVLSFLEPANLSAHNRTGAWRALFLSRNGAYSLSSEQSAVGVNQCSWSFPRKTQTF